ncbi:SusC/RagA family TonB-linked outer membrane protein [Hyunsoonleella pacifica]|uniref:TonB-dependent receptor n=1 Tax=Hyunsoonleella pacifica TaxID=1080224 RepID=A0A4Q9FML7_9FLAO|nr:TonB-dependent receptor [Hyunsoonleella pacifica]TBN13050.1 TonB-dependent receptor [Hyunsoonleella pacifica]GGD27579.1 SusC/RagA family TonB-linked outer membrane protein [Hyunsoonleella pacifica]
MKKTKQLKKVFLLLLSLCFALTASAQEKTVQGTVTSQSDGSVLPGVNVVVKGTSSGASTDFDGNYSIKVSEADAVLVFSYIGYATLEVKVGNSSTLDVKLEEDLAALDEVVVVGYGARKKSDLTGAVSSVKSEELNAFPVLDAAQALQGRAAGVVVQSNNGGEPGAPINIQIRGNTSINASSSPLIVVDGFVGATFPQPNDIASIEVLKDASATAIYGSQGSNGVVMVTTKKGRSGALTIELNSNYSVQNTANELDLLDANQFATYQQAINPSYVQGPANTDWQDLLYRTGSTQNHQASFSGGTDKVNFYASANYFKQDGVLINSEFERFTFLSNIDAQVTDKLKLGINVFGSRGTENGVPTQSTGETANGGGDDVVSGSFRFAPDLGVLDANGLNTVNGVGDDIDNPFAVATEGINETKTDVYRANLYANYDILENLTFKTTFGFSTTNETFGLFRPSTLITTAGGNVGGRAIIDNFKRTSLISENYLTYTKEIAKGKLTLLAGYSYQKRSRDNFAAGAQGFTSDSFSFRNLSGGAVQLIPTSSLVESEIQSQFGRINFDYDDKYLITATIRRDGASNFAANEKYAIFPSAALGWKVSNENFLKDSDKISNLKLRVSYGVTGNQAISPFESLARFDNIYAVNNGQTVNAVTPDQPANPNLKWESSFQTNVGLDLGLFNNKVSLSLDYYNIDTKDLIIGDNSQPQFLGFLTPASLRNIGEVNNKGFEINLNTRNISNENFSWTTDFNFSTNQNEVVALSDGDNIDLFLDASPGYFNLPRTHLLREGEVLGAFWGYDYQGVYQGGDLPAGTALLPGGEAGDQLFTDVDGSGDISPSDQQIIGDPTPDFTFGITNNFTYKNFDLNIFFQGVQGGDIMNLTAIQLFNGDSNATTEILNSWTPSNTNTNIPRAKLRGKEISSRFVEDGSYIRLKNIALGYTLPSDVVEKLGMQNIRLSISAQNLLTFTDYSGLDPEVSYFGSGGGSNSDSNTTNGFDFGNYPTLKSVNFSLNLRF